MGHFLFWGYKTCLSFTGKNLSVSDLEKLDKTKNTELLYIKKDLQYSYEKAMLNEGKSYTTISMYIRSMRALFNEAKNAGIIKEAQYPFGKGQNMGNSGENLNISLINRLLMENFLHLCNRILKIVLADSQY